MDVEKSVHVLKGATDWIKKTQLINNNRHVNATWPVRVKGNVVSKEIFRPLKFSNCISISRSHEPRNCSRFVLGGNGVRPTRAVTFTVHSSRARWGFGTGPGPQLHGPDRTLYPRPIFNSENAEHTPIRITSRNKDTDTTQVCGL